MVRAVVERDLEVEKRIPSNNSAQSGLTNTLFDRCDVFAWNNSSLDLIDKLDPRPRLRRLNAHARMTILTAPAALTHELALSLCLPTNGLAIRHLRPANIRFDFVLPFHAIDDDLEM